MSMSFELGQRKWVDGRWGKIFKHSVFELAGAHDEYVLKSMFTCFY